MPQKFYVHTAAMTRLRSFWTTPQFLTGALGLFLNAYVFGIAATAMTWLPSHHEPALWLLLWSPWWVATGILSGGFLADHLGRRRILLLSPWLYLLGSAWIFWSASLWAVFGGTLLLLFNAGLESTTVLTYAQELIPPQRKTL
ncbi:MAG: MFS transporter, partial [Firmicutes bacterium]|nr:MFS transporter [Bacillota bacterium]